MTTLQPLDAVIYDHLKKVGNISGMEAIGLYKARHLPSIIHRIRKAGYRVNSNYQKDATGQRYARYTID